MSALGLKQTFTDLSSGKIFFAKIGERKGSRYYIDREVGSVPDRCTPPISIENYG